MSREGRSYIRKRRRGCLGGCLVNVLLALGAAALLFVGACVLGVIVNDPETGKPSIVIENIKNIEALENVKMPEIDLPQVSLPESVRMPIWAYGVSSEGLTVKTLRAGEGEAVLVCCDGYTMLVGSGGNGLATVAQLLLCGVRSLSAAVAPCAQADSIGGMATVLAAAKPDYLLYQDSQAKTEAYNRMISAAQKNGRTQLLVPAHGLTFSLGGATVTVIGPTRRLHDDERDDGLSIRVDYGETSVLIMGTITGGGEEELIYVGVDLDADVLICARGGSAEATSSKFAQAVSPEIALMTGSAPAESVKITLERVGAEIYTAKEHGVMTVVSDGTQVTVRP